MEVEIDLNLQATALECYDNCHYLFWWKYIFNKNSEVIPENNAFMENDIWMIKGKMIHRTIDYFLTEEKDNPAIAEVKLYKIWEEILKNGRYRKSEAVNTWGINILQAFYKYFFKDKIYEIKTYETEKKVNGIFSYRNLNLDLVGRIDQLNKSCNNTIDINDWKAKKKYEKINNRKFLIGYYQLSCYAMLLSPEKIHKLNIVTLVENEDIYVDSWLYTKETEKNVKALITGIIDKSLDFHRDPEEWQTMENTHCNRCYLARNDACPLYGGEYPPKIQIETSKTILEWEKLLTKAS